jgi:hypothetical protein
MCVCTEVIHSHRLCVCEEEEDTCVYAQRSYTRIACVCVRRRRIHVCMHRGHTLASPDTNPEKLVP